MPFPSSITNVYSSSAGKTQSLLKTVADSPHTKLQHTKPPHTKLQHTKSPQTKPPQTNHSIPKYDSLLSKKPLNQFKKVSIVFGSQNLRSPISSFGHTLLVFHDSPIPSPDSPTFEYLGNTSVPFFVFRSLFWTIPGAYRLVSWNQKYWEYERENRDIWIIPLKITKLERTKLNHLIQESLSNQGDYYNFLFTNCSWYIFKILQKSLNNIDCSVKFYVYPIETIQALKVCNKIGEPIYRPAVATRLVQAFQVLTSKEKTLMKKISPWNFPEIKSLKKKSPGPLSLSPLKTAITEWIDYTLPRTDDKETRNELFKFKKQYHSPLLIPRKKMTELQSKRNGSLTLSWQKGMKSEIFSLKLSPGYWNFLNSINNNFWADHIELLSIEMSFDKHYVFLSSFSILDMNTSHPGNLVESSFVRDIYAGWRRHTVSLKQYWDEGLIRLGIGLSDDLGEGLRFSLLPFLELGVNRSWTEKDLNSISGLARLGLTARMFIRFSDVARFKAEFHQPLLTYGGFINQKSAVSIVVFDYYSFVSSLQYQSFSIKGHEGFNHFFGMSLSRLF